PPRSCHPYCSTTRSTPTPTLFPYTTLFRSPVEDAYHHVTAAGAKKILLAFASDCYINSGGIAVLIGILSESRKKEQAVRMTGLRSEEHTSELQSRVDLVCRLLLEKKNK